MSNSINIPQIVLEAFPVLLNAKYVRRLASAIPLVPDTNFDIFMLDSGQVLVLISTDYADPQSQSLELKGASGHYELEFMNLIKPYSKNNDTLKILEHDDMEGDFLIKEDSTYYYMANAQQNLAS